MMESFHAEQHYARRGATIMGLTLAVEEITAVEESDNKFTTYYPKATDFKRKTFRQAFKIAVGSTIMGDLKLKGTDVTKAFATAMADAWSNAWAKDGRPIKGGHK